MIALCSVVTCPFDIMPQLLKLLQGPVEITLKDGNNELRLSVNHLGEEPIDCFHCTTFIFGCGFLESRFRAPFL